MRRSHIVGLEMVHGLCRTAGLVTAGEERGGMNDDSRPGGHARPGPRLGLGATPAMTPRVSVPSAVSGTTRKGL